MHLSWCQTTAGIAPTANGNAVHAFTHTIIPMAVLSAMLVANTTVGHASGRLGPVAGIPGHDGTHSFALPEANTAHHSALANRLSQPSDDPIVLAAGDIACPADHPVTDRRCHYQSTSELILSLSPTAVLPLGDMQYDVGDLQSFRDAYEPTWGRFKSISRPIPGNHEYYTSGARGYFSYFGPIATPRQPECTSHCEGWYSYDLGGWRLLALNSECSEDRGGGCGPGSSQFQWVQSELASSPTTCTLAYWHRPVFTSRSPDMGRRIRDIFALLYEHDADLLLSGHGHYYERFAPQAPNAAADPVRGIRQFVVGTGGHSFFQLTDVAPNSERQIGNTFGVLKLVLRPTGYDYAFVAEGGAVLDSGSGTCH